MKGRPGRRGRSVFVCMLAQESVYARANVRLDEAAYIIAIHNQYFYVVSKVKRRRRRRRCKSTNTIRERGREE